MSDIFDLLVTKITGDRPMVEPRLPSLFENKEESSGEMDGLFEETSEVSLPAPTPQATTQSTQAKPQAATPSHQLESEPESQVEFRIDTPQLATEQLAPTPTEPDPIANNHQPEYTQQSEPQTITFESIHQDTQRIVVDQTVRAQPVSRRTSTPSRPDAPTLTEPTADLTELPATPAEQRVVQEVIRTQRLPAQLVKEVTQNTPSIEGAISFHQTLNPVTQIEPVETVEPSSSPIVNVSIGRVEINASPRPTPAPTTRAVPVTKRESALEQHLRKRDSEMR